MRGTYSVRGVKVRTGSARRYVVVTIRLTDRTVSIERRSDSLETVRTFARGCGYSPGSAVVILDTHTGQEVAR